MLSWDRKARNLISDCGPHREWPSPGTEILLIAELRGGDDDYRELYCVTVEWDWDDDTHSETTPDCDPYEPGVSKIRRRYSTRHRFDIGGRYEIRINLKRRDDVVASARTSIEIRGQRIR